MGGDFNTVLNASGKKGGSSTKDSFQGRMEEIMEHWDLIDIKPQVQEFHLVKKKSQ